MTEAFEVPGNSSVGPRKVWLERAVAGRAEDCTIFLDGELYRDRVGAPEIVRNLEAANRVAPMDCVYVSAVDARSRHLDFTCNEAYAAYLADDLRLWIEQTIGHYDRYVLCGLSLSGLAALFTALKYPDAFFGAICQSPSAWWNDEWLARSLDDQKPAGGRLWISVGNQELAENVTHPPTEMFQRSNQLDSCRRLARKLADRGVAVQFSEFPGGHDPTCWAAELPAALTWLSTS